MLDEHTYPAKRTEKPGGDFTVRHFILPIKIRGTTLWAWLDTGANISILPKEIAINEIGLNIGSDTDGMYSLAGLVRVPYHSIDLSVNIPKYINNTIPELDLSPYESSSETAVRLQDVNFQVPNLTWSEIADHLQATPPVQIVDSDMPWVILGLYGVLDQLNLSFVGQNSVSISSKRQS